MDSLFHKLSTKEYMVLQLLADGSSNKVIAIKLDVTEATIKVHLKSILRKLRVINRTQAAIWYVLQNRAAPAPPGLGLG